MKAVQLYAKGDLRVADIAEPPPPQPGSVAFDVTAAGICGSDLHNFRTGQWISRSPSVPGHEFIGRVTALGEGVTGFAVGDRVIADSRFWCGECASCTSGNAHLCVRLGFVGEVCDGGFAGKAVLPQRLLLKLPDDVPDDVAVMAEPVAVAIHAIRRLRMEQGASVLIAGCGPIGGLAALVLAESGGHDIYVADRNAARLALVCEVTGAKPVTLDRGAPRPAIHYGIEATGSPAALGELIHCIAPGGAVALVGISHGALDLDPNILVEREISLTGCHAFRDELPDAVRLLGRAAPRARRLIDRVIGLDETPEAYRRLIAGEAAGLKTVIRP